MAVEIIWEQRGAIGVFSGHVTEADARYFIETVAASPRFDDLEYRIADTSAVQSHDMDDSQMEHVSAVDWAGSRNKRRLVTAAVVVSESVREFLEKYRSIGLSAHPSQFFRTRAEAMAWIERQLPRR
jgi:hypothetical protein